MVFIINFSALVSCIKKIIKYMGIFKNHL